MKKVIALISVIALLITGCVLPEPPYVEVTTETTVFEGRFYYEQLSNVDKNVYRELYQGITESLDKIYVHSTDGDRANEILMSVIYDFPEVFWTDGSATATTYGEKDQKGTYTVVEPVYAYAGETRAKMQQEIDEAVQEIINSVPTEYDEYGKIKYIYEYLIGAVEYVENAPDSQNIYSTFVNRGTVCAGYAKANQYLLNELGIGCTYVQGTANDGEVTDNHAWNIVKCNDKYYYIDLTWADPIPAEGEEDSFHEMTYDYLCCSDSEIGWSHVLQEGYDYPECTSDDLNYYRNHGMYYESIDRQQLLNAAKGSINEKSSSTVYKFASKELYEQGKGVLLDDVLKSAARYLCEKYGLQSVTYNYLEEDKMNKMEVYWSYE